MHVHIEETSNLTIDRVPYPVDDCTNDVIQIRLESTYKRSHDLVRERKKYPEGILETRFIDNDGKIICVISADNYGYICSFKDTEAAWNEYKQFLNSIRENIKR